MKSCKSCIRCGVERPLSFFRRWVGAKKIWSAICAECRPTKSLKEMTPKERLNEAAHGRQHAYVMQVMNDQARLALDLKRSEASTRVQAKRRRAAWDAAIRDRLVAQRWWCERILRAELSPELRAFATRYHDILRNMHGQVFALRGRTKKGTPIYPTPDEANPRTYITDAEYASLTRLYSQCSKALSGRLYKEPDFLYWKESK